MYEELSVYCYAIVFSYLATNTFDSLSTSSLLYIPDDDDDDYDDDEQYEDEEKEASVAMVYYFCGLQLAYFFLPFFLSLLSMKIVTIVVMLSKQEIYNDYEKVSCQSHDDKAVELTILYNIHKQCRLCFTAMTYVCIFNSIQKHTYTDKYDNLNDIFFKWGNNK